MQVEEEGSEAASTTEEEEEGSLEEEETEEVTEVEIEEDSNLGVEILVTVDREEGSEELLGTSSAILPLPFPLLSPLSHLPSSNHAPTHPGRRTTNDEEKQKSLTRSRRTM